MSERKKWCVKDDDSGNGLSCYVHEVGNPKWMFSLMDFGLALRIVREHNLWPEFMRVIEYINTEVLRGEAIQIENQLCPNCMLSQTFIRKVHAVLSEARAIEQPVEEGNSREAGACAWLNSAREWRLRADVLEAKLASAEARLKEIHDAGTKWLDEVLKGDNSGRNNED